MPIPAAIIPACQAIVANPAGQVGVDHHPLANLPALHASSQASNLAGPIRARDMGIFQLDARPAVAHPQIQAVEGSSSQSHQYLPRPRFGLGEIRIFQYFWAAVLATAVAATCPRARPSPTASTRCCRATAGSMPSRA